MTSQLSNVKVIDQPKPNWQWCFNDDWHALSFSLYYKNPPCWFHRFMMRTFLGIHWRKIND